MNLKVGTTLQGGKYRILRYLSRGGFGCTYEAKYEDMDSVVAIKEFFVKDFCNRGDDGTISVATQSKKELVDRLKAKFVEEAQALFKMQHNNIVRVTDKFEENGTAYYVMDYISGKSLNAIVEERGYLSEQEALGYIRQVSDALDYVHSSNRLHLDVKPHNIMVDGNGKAILIDFGVSKQYDEINGENNSTLMGHTPGYAPLEQSGNGVREFSPTTDIYALGATLFKLVTGMTPPPASEVNENGLPAFPGYVSAHVRRAIEAAMQPRRKDRPQSIAEFLALLEPKAMPAADILIAAGCSEEKTLVESGQAKENAAVACSATAVKSGSAQVKENGAAAGGASAQHSGAPGKNYSSGNGNEEASPRKNGKAWIIILLLVVAGVGAALWFMSGKGSEGVKVVAKSPAAVTSVSAPETGNVEEVKVNGQKKRNDVPAPQTEVPEEVPTAVEEPVAFPDEMVSSVPAEEPASVVNEEPVIVDKRTKAPYKVGDYYNDGTKEGVVFTVSKDGMHGKIISLEQSDEKWAVKEVSNVDTGAENEKDGMVNMNKVKKQKNWEENYPAFAWCAGLGDGWYLPAEKELVLVRENKELINKKLKEHSCEVIDGGTWSSTERNLKNYKHEARICYLGKVAHNGAASKTNSSRVRAVAAF